ncbi:MAG: inorganic diphosphatase [Candidatus Pacebacteria bacterium]|jgi:inorganic pyrophosphatase|nr:inorganic pyrophosphatase [bacterium]MDP6527334.1 inorganic diphosphatase [Candidatus Paceibacterota bacterium]MDP6659388.1 inorganic diphosphatase [Candidatus Paceibacterota bacterium]|tara:strand:+ start:40730 stop:41266 length:537 start_codon:yes stop_codon:yes gene_type:complete
MNLWHDVKLGDKAPEIINTIIEIPKGSFNKYEIDKDTGLIKLDRANYTAAPYPFDYGFAPQTYWEDDDALDVIVLTTFPLNTGILVPVRPVAVMEMIDDGDSDYKIVGVPADDKRWDNIKDLSDLNEHNLKEYQHFFETYKTLKGKPAPVEVKGYKGRDDAIKAVEKSIKLYKEKFVN